MSRPLSGLGNETSAQACSRARTQHLGIRARDLVFNLPPPALRRRTSSTASGFTETEVIRRRQRCADQLAETGSLPADQVHVGQADFVEPQNGTHLDSTVGPAPGREVQVSTTDRHRVHADDSVLRIAGSRSSPRPASCDVPDRGIRVPS